MTPKDDFGKVHELVKVAMVEMAAAMLQKRVVPESYTVDITYKIMEIFEKDE